MIEPKQWQEALGRIALTPDGWLLYCGLHKVAMGLPPGTDPSDGALRANLGRRSLAHEIMTVMKEGIDERGKRTGIDKLSEQPVAFAEPKPVAANPAGRGARRRITADTAVPGWDAPADRAT